MFKMRKISTLQALMTYYEANMGLFTTLLMGFKCYYQKYYGQSSLVAVLAGFISVQSLITVKISRPDILQIKKEEIIIKWSEHFDYIQNYCINNNR